MNKGVTFLVGLGVGSVVTYLFTKKVIQQKADEEISSVVDTFKKRFDELEKTTKSKENTEEINSKMEIKDELVKKTPTISAVKEEVKSVIDDLGYSIGVDSSEEKHIDNTVNQLNIPYVISEEEFGEIGNDEETLYYYADGVLADEQDNIVFDVYTTIGNSLTQFGEFDETMYVRNEEREIDYVIVRSEKKFSDITNIDGDNI